MQKNKILVEMELKRGTEKVISAEVDIVPLYITELYLKPIRFKFCPNYFENHFPSPLP